MILINAALKYVRFFYVRQCLYASLTHGSKVLTSEYVWISADPRAELALLTSRSDSPELGSYPAILFAKCFRLIVC